MSCRTGLGCHLFSDITRASPPATQMLSSRSSCSLSASNTGSIRSVWSVTGSRPVAITATWCALPLDGAAMLERVRVTCSGSRTA